MLVISTKGSCWETKIDALKQPKASPGDTLIDYMDDILDCEKTPNPDRDSLRYSESTAVASHRSTQDSLAGINIPMPLGDDAKFCHRSQWNSSHRIMKYQPQMFNTGDITKKDAPVCHWVAVNHRTIQCFRSVATMETIFHHQRSSNHRMPSDRSYARRFWCRQL